MESSKTHYEFRQDYSYQLQQEETLKMTTVGGSYGFGPWVKVECIEADWKEKLVNITVSTVDGHNKIISLESAAFWSEVKSLLHSEAEKIVERQIYDLCKTSFESMSGRVNIILNSAISEDVHNRLRNEIITQIKLLVDTEQVIRSVINQRFEAHFDEKINLQVREVVDSRASQQVDATIKSEDIGIMATRTIKELVTKKVGEFVTKEIIDVQVKEALWQQVSEKLLVDDKVHARVDKVVHQQVQEKVELVLRKEVHTKVDEVVRLQVKEEADSDTIVRKIDEITQQLIQTELTKVFRAKFDHLISQRIQDKADSEVRNIVVKEVSRQYLTELTKMVIRDELPHNAERIHQMINEQINIKLSDVLIMDKADDIIRQQLQDFINIEISSQYLKKQATLVIREKMSDNKKIMHDMIEEQINNNLSEVFIRDHIYDMISRQVQERVDMVVSQQVTEVVNQQLSEKVNCTVRQQVHERVEAIVQMEEIQRLAQWEVGEIVGKMVSKVFSGKKLEEMAKQQICEKVNRIAIVHIQGQIDEMVRQEVYRKMTRWRSIADIKHHQPQFSGYDLDTRLIIGKLQTGWHTYFMSPLPWSVHALEKFQSSVKNMDFIMLEPKDDPSASRLDTVFSLPQELWPVLPPGAMYCLEAVSPRGAFKYLQLNDFPEYKVRVSTYFGKWSQHLVDYMVAWQPIPPAELEVPDGKQSLLKPCWEPRQVVAHTTKGEYQYAKTCMQFCGYIPTKNGTELVEFSDAHGVDILDTKAAHESAPRNSDKDRSTHLIDPPRPNTWGALARRNLIGNLRANGGGAYMHHVNYDNSGLRTNCGRRIPAGYYFTVIPSTFAATSGVGMSSGGGDYFSKREHVSVTSPSLGSLAPKQQWCTYDVPFDHPIHSLQAKDLRAEMAAAEGCSASIFSDSAVAVQVANQELRMQHTFVPGPLVVPKWKDIPRLCAEHMEAARLLMPVTELDMYGSSKLHQLIYHLQCAATLEYDRLDAKLLLLPQMARLGKKSAEIDTWLQVLIKQAIFLYEELKIMNCSRWHQSQEDRKQPARLSVQYDQSTPLVNPTGSAWGFPDQLVNTSFASLSALNKDTQVRAPPKVRILPAHCISMEEWAAIARIMDTSRHAILYDHWVRLRPLMTTVVAHGQALGAEPARSDTGATAFGEGGCSRQQESGESYSYGAMNRELLDYLHLDLEAMSAPGFVPQAPSGVPLKQHGYRGDGPLPSDLVADTPALHRPVRCRGTEETPLPPELQGMDLWNLRTKDVQVDIRSGATGFSQPPPLQGSKSFTHPREQQQAVIRQKFAQRIRIGTAHDDLDVPTQGPATTAGARTMAACGAAGVVGGGAAKDTRYSSAGRLQEQHEVEEIIKQTVKAARLKVVTGTAAVKRETQSRFLHATGTSLSGAFDGGGPEPFSLEKIISGSASAIQYGNEGRPGRGRSASTTRTAGDVSAGGASGSGDGSSGGSVAYEIALARRRAIADAEAARSRFSRCLPKDEVLNLFVTYCNLAGEPKLIELLQKAVDTSKSKTGWAATSAAAASPASSTRSAVNNPSSMFRPDMDSDDATAQRIKSMAWMLGVTCRGIPNETYTSFLSRVLGWPSEMVEGLNRARATEFVARALIQGHDFTALARPPRK